MQRFYLALLVFLGALLPASPSWLPGPEAGQQKGLKVKQPFRHLAEEEKADSAEVEETEEAETAEKAEEEALAEANEELGGEEELGSEEAAEGEEGGEEGEEGEEEEEYEFDVTDIEVAHMLLGAVIFVVSLFYLVNWDDDDIRYYSMNIISMTMSIFSAVLMFQGINEQIRRFSIELTHAHRVFIQFLHCGVYVVAMQLVIGVVSGVLPMFGKTSGDFNEKKWTIADGLRSDYSAVLDEKEEEYVRNKKATKSVWIDEFGVEVPVALTKHKLEIARRRMRCWAMLLAHMSGFAAINSGAQLQEVEIFTTSPFMAMLPGLIMFGILQAMFALARLFRQKAMDRSDPLRVGLCNETVVEAENDVSSLSLSFLVVQALRFAVGGVMPNAEGEEIPIVVHSWSQIGILFALAVFLCLTAIVLSLKLLHGETSEEENQEEEPFCARMGQILCNFLAMCFAWLVLFGSKWLVVKWDMFNYEAMIGQIILALALSVVCGCAVFLLDFIDDQTRGSSNSQDGAKAIRVIIQAIAILIGFSWEHCFDAGVLAAASSAPHKRLMKFVMGLVVFFFLVPAWRRHILTKVMAYEQMKQQRAHVSKKKLRHSQRNKDYRPVAEATSSPRELQVGVKVETPASGGGPFLVVPKGEKVKVWPLDGNDEWVWATHNGRGGLLPKKAVPM